MLTWNSWNCFYHVLHLSLHYRISSKIKTDHLQSSSSWLRVHRCTEGFYINVRKVSCLDCQTGLWEINCATSYPRRKLFLSAFSDSLVGLQYTGVTCTLFTIPIFALCSLPHAQCLMHISRYVPTATKMLLQNSCLPGKLWIYNRTAKDQNAELLLGGKIRASLENPRFLKSETKLLWSGLSLVGPEGSTWIKYIMPVNIVYSEYDISNNLRCLID